MERIYNIFDYYGINRERYDECSVVDEGNKYYGMNHILKRYSNYEGVINASIEHGFCMLDSSNISSHFESNVPVYLVPSVQRAEFLKDKIDKIIIPIGPIIHYAKNLYGEYALKSTKKELGKTLVVYPLHNIENMCYLEDRRRFIEHVKTIVEKYEFNTVLVSIYFIDLERGAHLAYQKEGWNIVSAGRRLNYDYMDCVRTILSLADYSIFQSYTSALGYCGYMGIPFSIYSADLQADFGGKTEYGTLGPMDRMKEFEIMFSEYSPSFSQKQNEFCSYWHGYDCVRSEEELHLIFDFCEAIDNNMSREKVIEIAQDQKFDLIRTILEKSID